MQFMDHQKRWGIQRKNFRILQKTENQTNIFETVSSSVSGKSGTISSRAKVPSFKKVTRNITIYIYIYIKKFYVIVFGSMKNCNVFGRTLCQTYLMMYTSLLCDVHTFIHQDAKLSGKVRDSGAVGTQFESCYWLRAQVSSLQ